MNILLLALLVAFSCGVYILKTVLIKYGKLGPDGVFAFRMAIGLSFAPTLYYLLAYGIRLTDKPDGPLFNLIYKVMLLQHMPSHNLSVILMIISWMMLPLITAFIVALINRLLGGK